MFSARQWTARCLVPAAALLLLATLTACSDAAERSSSAARPASAPATSPAVPNRFGEVPGEVDGASVAGRVRTALAQWSSVQISSADATDNHATTARLEVSYFPADDAFRYLTPGHGFSSAAPTNPGDPAPVTIATLGDLLTLREVNGDYYLKANPAYLPKPWLRIRADSDDAWAAWVHQNMGATVRHLNPYVVATMLGAGDHVYLRPATAGDAAGTTRYQAVLRGPSILKVMSDADAKRLQGSVTSLTEVAEITLDAQNRPLSLQVKVSGTTVTQSQTFAQWAGPVTIPVPPMGQIVDSSDLAGLGYQP